MQTSAEVRRGGEEFKRCLSYLHLIQSLVLFFFSRLSFWLRGERRGSADSSAPSQRCIVHLWCPKSILPSWRRSWKYIQHLTLLHLILALGSVLDFLNNIPLLMGQWRVKTVDGWMDQPSVGGGACSSAWLALGISYNALCFFFFISLPLLPFSEFFFAFKNSFLICDNWTILHQAWCEIQYEGIGCREVEKQSFELVFSRESFQRIWLLRSSFTSCFLRRKLDSQFTVAWRRQYQAANNKDLIRRY